jgi:hypothetical protein
MTGMPLRLIDVRSFAEGMSSNRHSIAELLALASVAHAVLVEPCFRHGRLGVCPEDRFDDRTLRLGDVLDLSALQRFAFILPWRQAREAAALPLDARARSVCLHSGSPQDTCRRFGLNRSIAHSSASEALALATHGEAVLHVHAFRRGSVRGLNASLVATIEGAIDFAPRQYAQVLPARTRYCPSCTVSMSPALPSAYLEHVASLAYVPLTLRQVAELRKLLRLPRSFTAFHWRSETTHDYVAGLDLT